MPDEQTQPKVHVDNLAAENARLREVLRAFVPPCDAGTFRRPCNGIATHYRNHADHTTSHDCRKHAARHDEVEEFRYATEMEALLAGGA